MRTYFLLPDSGDTTRLTESFNFGGSLEKIVSREDTSQFCQEEETDKPISRINSSRWLGCCCAGATQLRSLAIADLGSNAIGDHLQYTEVLKSTR
jgi:hypothetical protein